MHQILSNNLGKHLRLVFAVFFFCAQVFSAALPAFGQSAALPVAEFHLPEEEGHVETVFEGRNPGWVAIIKDAHAIPQTQNSIAQILARLEQSYGVDWVGAEGAAGIFQTQLFRSFPDAQYLKEKLSDFIKRGELGGAAIAALHSKGPAVFEGMEDARTYEAGLRDYQRARKELVAWQNSLNQLEREVILLKKKHYSLRGQSWDFKFARLDVPDSEARAWAAALLEMRRRIPYFSKKYPNLNAAWIEMRISRAGADSMRPRIQNWKKAIEQMDPAVRQLAAWQSDFQAWRTGSLSDAEYAVRLQAFCEARELKMNLPESLSALVSLGGRLKALRGGAWVQEWSLARSEAEKLVFSGQTEQRVFELDQTLTKLKKAADLKISRDEWVRVSQNKKASGNESDTRDLEIEAVAAELQKANEQFLESAAADFYKGAVKREDYFENKLEHNLKAKSGRRAAVVMGGFHAEALADSLRKKGISFVVLMPATGAIPETTLYENLMRGEVSWSSHFKVVNGRIRIYESFAAAMIHRLLNLNQQKQNPEQVLAHFKNWRENLMRGILRSRQSQEALNALALLDREVLSSLYGEAFETAQAKALTQFAPSSFQDSQALFRAASGMTLQPWAAAPLGDLDVAPTETRVSGPKPDVKKRSEYREDDEAEEGETGWIHLSAWTLAVISVVVIGWQIWKMVENTDRFYTRQAELKAAEVQKQRLEMEAKKKTEDRRRDLQLRKTKAKKSPSEGKLKKQVSARSEMRVLPRERTASDQELGELWNAKLEKDGSFSKKIKTLEDLKRVSDSAQEKGYVIVLPSVASVEQMLQLKFPAAIRIYPRQVEAENFEKAMEIMLERQIRAGRVVEKDGVLKWQPFMQIFEDGKTVIYVVYQKEKLVPELFEGSVPEEIQKNADHIFVFNPGRAKRPGAAAPAVQKLPDDHPDLNPPAKTIEVAPPFIESQIPEQMFFWVAAEGTQDPSQRWMVVVNRYPVLPPSLDGNTLDQPQAIVLSRDVERTLGRSSYAQSWMHRPENLSDILQTHAELEGVPQEKRAALLDLAEYISFAVGSIFNSEKPDSHNVLIVGKNTNHVLAVNGYRHPDAPLAAHGGASQLHGHAQHVNAYLPIKNAPPEAFTKIATLPLGESSADILVMNWEGKTALVVDYGSQRIFIFSRPNGKPAKFDGNFSFLELGGMIVVASIARLFQLNQAETESLAQAQDPSEWLLEHRKDLVERGVGASLLHDAREAFSNHHAPMTANAETMTHLAYDLKDLHYLREFQTAEESLQITRDPLFNEMSYSPTEVAKLLSQDMPRFEWVRSLGGKPLLLSTKFPQGILALMMQFRELAVWGREAERGQVALRSMRFHARRGDLFRYLKDWAQTGGKKLQPFTRKIESLAEQAEKYLQQAESFSNRVQQEEAFEKALAANYEALQLIDQLGEWMAEEALKFYLSESKFSEREWFYKNVVSNRNLRKYISRILAKDPSAVSLKTDIADGVQAFRITHQGKSFILGINTGAISIPQEKEGLPDRVLAHVAITEEWKSFLTEAGIQAQARYQITDAKTGKTDRRFLSAAEELPLEIPKPEGLRLIQIEPQNKPTFGVKSPQPSGLNAREIQNSIEQVLNDPESLKFTLQDLIEEVEETAVDEAGRKKLTAFMYLIAVIEPALIEKVKKWNVFAYASLKRLMAQNPELFSNQAAIVFHKPDRNTTIVLSRSLNGGGNGQNIVFALQFYDSPVNPNDGKVWSVVRGLGSDDKPISLDRDSMYQVQNLLEPNQTLYERRASGAEFMRHWDIGIPVRDAGSGHLKRQHGWGVDAYRFYPVYPEAPKTRLKTSFALPVMPELMGAFNLMDVGAEKRSDGTVTYSDSFQKLKRLLPFFRALGYGKIYLYGGLYEMGEISKRLHGVAADPSRYVVDDDVFPRTMIRGGYGVKADGVLADNKGNSFSPISMRDLNPGLSDVYTDNSFSRGSHERSRAQLMEVAVAAKAQGMKVVADFIPWLAPEGVTEDNYKMFFYKELPDDFTQGRFKKSFPDLSEEQKQAVMRDLIAQGGFFVKRFGEPGSDRLVLIRHMYNEPGVDQAMPNPFHPLTQQYYLNTLKDRLAEGVEEVRVDLAHKLLRQNLKPIFDGWLVDGWQVGLGGEYRANEEPFETVIRQAKAYAAEKGQVMEFDMEAYDVIGPEHVAVHRHLQSIGADRAYFVPVHHDYRRIAKGDIDANHYQALFELVHNLKNGKLPGRDVAPLLEMIFASNYDEPSLNQMGGPKRAMWFLLLLMAKSGVPVLMDFRDMLDHYGQFIPIPGSSHPFPTLSERERRRDFNGLISELERAPSIQEARALSGLEPSDKPINLVFLDNEKRYQFISAAWNNPGLESDESPEWRVALMNFKPHDDQVVWVDAPVKEGAWEAVDSTTGEIFQIENGRIQGVVMPSTLSYRTLRLVPAARSESRTAPPEEDVIAAGEAARTLSIKHPAHFVPAAIVAGNHSAAVGNDVSARQKTIESLMSALEQRVHAYFSKSKNEPLHLGFAMAYDPAAESEMLMFAEKIQELKLLYGDRVQNHFKVLLTPAQAADESVKKFTANLKLKGAQAKEVSSAVTVSGELKDRHSFAYGLENLGISSEELFTAVRHLAVDSDYSMQDIFPVALALNLHTAFEPRLDSGVVEKIPQHFQHVLGLRKGRLSVLAGFLEAQLFEAQVQKLIASMA